jgi:hypothetical protein
MRCVPESRKLLQPLYYVKKDEKFKNFELHEYISGKY